MCPVSVHVPGVFVPLQHCINLHIQVQVQLRANLLYQLIVALLSHLQQYRIYEL